MNLKVLKQTENKVIFHISNAEIPLVNALRRSLVEEVPTMAIEEVTFAKNNSALYDEILAHRMGLIPLLTDLKTYNFLEDCKCKGKGCARCQVKFALSAKGPCTVLASDLKSRGGVKPVYPNMPLTILLKNQDLQLEAVARLGKGKEHAKFSPGLAYYRFYPELKLTKDSNIKKCAELSKNLVVKGTKLEIKDITAWTEADEQICEENKVEVDHNQEEFIFTLESWGQLDTKKLPNLALEILEKKLKELDKLIK
ncbi:MAG: DNA-directed RNA polymerase subunit D [Nanoarchaeota archaeon]|jgi:DNA-directed RNA polymerase subunit D|nr:DNA-directed RNA polymerase subunit D [Nanoarchaeota archaeon]|tara:strand:- start:38591 stop:39352 length:762 start_codon:yes stop_codon:yes gene_type:complete